VVPKLSYLRLGKQGLSGLIDESSICLIAQRQLSRGSVPINDEVANAQVLSGSDLSVGGGWIGRKVGWDRR
jgi:hypothetical protein